MPYPDDEQTPSRSARKRAAQAVEELARRLVVLSPAELDRLPADPEIRQELQLIRKVPTLAARDRQVRHLAGLLRRREEELPALEAFLAGLDRGHHEELARFHRLEEWRDRLCDPNTCPEALQEVARALPQADPETLSRLARAAHGGDKKAFREIFRCLRRASEAV